MIYVVAGTADEAYNYINRKIEERISNGEKVSSINEYGYVHNVNVVRGVRNPTGVFIGTWKKRKDIFDIVSALRSAHDVPNKALRQVWQELMIEAATPVPGAPRQPSQGILRGAEMMAQAIDQEVLTQALRNINGGRNG